jgi:hypothetical protein
MKWLHGRTSGVFGAENNASVSVVPTSMSVEVSDGIGWIANSKGDGAVWWNDNEQTTGSKWRLTHGVADGALERIDRIVVSWETTNYVALPTISVLPGVPSSNPTPPALTNNGVMRQISLAQVRIPAGAISLSAALVTDERLNPDVCGIVTDSVRIDTSVMQSQFDAMLIAVQNELANVLGGSGFDPAPARFDNVIIRPDFFALFEPENDEEIKLIEMGYTYRGAVGLSGVLESMYPYVTLSLYDVDVSGADIANQFRCYNGGLYLYSDSIPGSDLVALTVECRKQSYSGGETFNGIATLNLDEDYTDADAQVEIKGTTYGVTNARTELGTNGELNFTVI